MSPVTPICTRSAQVVNVEHGSPALLCFVNGRLLPRTEFGDDAVTFDAQEAPGGSSA